MNAIDKALPSGFNTTMGDDFSPWWLLLSLAIRGAWAWGTAAKAEEKGRSPVLGALCGFFLGLIGYLIFYFLPAVDGAGGIGNSAPRTPISGTEAKRQQFSESQPGTCKVCGYANAPRESRCYQCGNTMASY